MPEKVDAGANKKGYQPLKKPIEEQPAKQAGASGHNPELGKKTQLIWQTMDDGFGSSRDFSNITGINGVISANEERVNYDVVPDDQQVTMKKNY